MLKLHMNARTGHEFIAVKI